MYFKMRNYLLLLGIFLLFANKPLHARTTQAFHKEYIFATCCIGDYAHEALNDLFHEDTLLDEKIFFCATCELAIDRAYQSKGVAFFKLFEEPKQNVYAKVMSALQKYKITRVVSLIKREVKLQLLRHTLALQNNIPLQTVASDPSSLQRIKGWITKMRLKEIEVPSGAHEAAKLLSEREFSLQTGVIGCGQSCKVFPNLVLARTDLHPSQTMHDVYALVEVEKREKPISAKQLKEEMAVLFQKHAAKFVEPPLSSQIVKISAFTPLDRRIASQER